MGRKQKKITKMRNTCIIILTLFSICMLNNFGYDCASDSGHHSVFIGKLGTLPGCASNIDMTDQSFMFVNNSLSFPLLQKSYFFCFVEMTLLFLADYENIVQKMSSSPCRSERVQYFMAQQPSLGNRRQSGGRYNTSICSGVLIPGLCKYVIGKFTV